MPSSSTLAPAFLAACVIAVRSVFEDFEPWKETLSAARTLAELPAAARKYVSFVERETECPLFLVSVGYRRDETIVLRDAFG